ncbi:LOW QUALITY PROTEIN: EF-hand calcium-binding domain-containing protein 5 [Phascolarctos cinereus]|uniref:LOW QUALITY PROTEIN: EF-hand calcium-binding domain-containing protein 5 n=1 Tax=Phascolarctos cinereus TaxID=38626 RepID=A0A6P5IAH3_PHACI|nr:LOW QUALITY PROTEIN: EF-hand calcium-binding domain-containing protein 5 [Phascolarctos cinereus]
MSKASIKKRGSTFESVSTETVSSGSFSQLQNMSASNKSIHTPHSEMPEVNGNDTPVTEEEKVQEDDVKEMPQSVSESVSVLVRADAPELGTSESVALNTEEPADVIESMFPWRDNFFEKIEKRSIAMQNNVINKFLLQKELDKKMDKKFPLDDLANEWLNDDKRTLDTQTYLLEKLLPTLMPGVEKMLMEVEKRKLLGLNRRTNFNPINYLGEYLMRHNPKYQKELPESSYLKAMKNVTKEMKTRIPDTPFNRVFKMKKEVNEKQEQREHISKIKICVGMMRKEALAMQFKEWLLDTNGMIPLPVIQNAAGAFLDTPAGRKAAALYQPLEFLGSMKDRRDEEGFIEEIFPCVKDLTSEMFTDFLKHLCLCADDFWEIVKRDRWRQKFLNLFLACDAGKMGFLDRERTLTLLENFYDKSPKIVKKLFRNPRYWPFIEFGDIEPAELWGDLEDERSPFESLEQIGAGEMRTPLFAIENQSSQYYTEEVEEEECEHTIISWPTTVMTYGDDSEPQETMNDEEEVVHEDVRRSSEQTQDDVGSTEELPLKSQTKKRLSQEAKQGETSTEEGESSAKEGEPSEAQGEPAKEEGEPAKEEGEPAKEEGEPAKEEGDLIKEEGEPAKEEGEPAKEEREPAKEEGDPAKEEGEPAKEEGEPAKEEGEPAKEDGRPIEPSSSQGSLGKQRDSVEEKRDSGMEARKSSGGPAKEDGSATEQKSSTTRAQEPGGEQEESSKRPQEPSMSAAEPGQVPTEKKASIEQKEAASLEESTALQEKSSQNISTDSPEEEKVEVQLKDSKSTTEENLPETGDKDTSCELRSQLIEGKPWSGELLTSDLSKTYMKYGEKKQAYLVSDDPRFSELRPIILKMQSQEESKIRSLFTKSYLTVPQFVQLLEMFVGNGVPPGVMKKFLHFLRKNYVETHEEKMNRLVKIHQETMEMRRKILLEALFRKWDNEGSGFLDLYEVDKLLFTYKEGMEKVSMMKAKLYMKLPRPHPGNEVRLNADQFGNYIELVVAELTGNENEVFDNVVEFLMMSLKRNHTEQLRSTARQKWLQRIQQAAETSGVCLEPVYTAVLEALTKDAEVHGNKKISAYIALLEENKTMPKRGNVLLRNVACTKEDAPFLLKQALYRDMKGISFTVVDQGKPIHVPQVQKHGNIHFWNPSREQKDCKGSFLAVPLEDAYKRSFGILGVDTLRDTSRKSIFVAHEISFYQGVANAFSIAYHYVHSREHILHVIATAVSWLRIVAPSIRNITTFLVEPGPDQDSDYVLRKMMYLDNKRHMLIFASPAILHRRENLFRDYIFRSIDTSEVIFTYALGNYHVVVPIRDRKGQALGLLDFTTAQKKMLSVQEYKDLQKMLKIVQEACNEILGECSGKIQKKYVLEMEHKGEVQRAGVLFLHIMLKEVQGRIRELNPQAFQELKYYYDQFLPMMYDPPLIGKGPPKPHTLVHDILKTILLILHPEWENTETVEDWGQCKEHITNDLIASLCIFDPTTENVKVDPDLISKFTKGNPRKIVWLQQSIAIEYLYHWALTCLCLIELKSKLEGKYAPPLPPGEMAPNRLQVRF